MSEIIDSVIKTRKISEQIALKSLTEIEGISEAELKDRIILEFTKHSEIFEEGYYSPPPKGIAVLFAEKPFDRFRYDNLRNPKYWSNDQFKFNKNTVGMIYFSPVNCKTNMIGDIGFTFYIGDDEKIKQHIKNCYNAILDIAKYIQIGMKFRDICVFANNFLKNKLKMTKWVALNSDPNQTINLGHTVPGSFENNLIFGNTFDEVKETIRKERVPFIDTENFEIPSTCAFTVESRLEDFNNPELPSVHFHFIVCFDEGKKTILDNYAEIFKTVGMDYMLN